MKLLFVAGWLQLGSLTSLVGDLNIANLAINLFTVTILVVVARPLIRSKQKDATIKDQSYALEAKDERLKERTAELEDAQLQKRQIEQAATHLKEQAAVWQAKYEEQAHYTAEGALDAVLDVIGKHEDGQIRRHVEIMGALGALGEAVKRP